MKKSKNKYVNNILTVIVLLMPVYGGVIGLFAGFFLFFCFKDCTPINTYAPYAVSAGGAVIGLGISLLLVPKDDKKITKKMSLISFAAWMSLYILIPLLNFLEMIIFDLFNIRNL